MGIRERSANLAPPTRSVILRGKEGGWQETGGETENQATYRSSKGGNKRINQMHAWTQRSRRVPTILYGSGSLSGLLRTNRRQQMTSKSERCFLSLLLLRLTFDNYFAVAWSTAGLLRWAACLWRDDVYLWAFVICQLWSVCFLQVQAGTDGGISWAVLLGVGCFSESSGQLCPHQFVHVHTGANRRLFCEITTTSKRSSLTGRSVFTTIQAVPSRRCCVPSKGTEVSRIG